MNNRDDGSIQLERIKATKARLTHELRDVTGVVGVGIGYDRERHRPNLKVMLERQPQAEQPLLPRQIDDIDVEYQVVGKPITY